MEDKEDQGRTTAAAAPYFCNICLQGFSESAELERHAQEHEAEESLNNYSNVQRENLELTIPSAVVNQSIVNATEAPRLPEANLVASSCVDPNVVTPFVIVNNVVDSELVKRSPNTYLCHVCQRGFSQRSHLETHSRIHSGERPFECIQCGATFSRRGNLVRHRLSHGGERKHKCNVCERRFSQKSHLQVHTRVHTGERPYKCDRCGYAFSRNGNLVRHQRASQEGKRKYSCIAPSLINQQENNLSPAQRGAVAPGPQAESEVQTQPRLTGIPEVSEGVTTSPHPTESHQEPTGIKTEQTPVVATTANIVQLRTIPYQVLTTTPNQLTSVQPIGTIQQIPNVSRQLVTVPQQISIHHLTAVHNNLPSVPLHLDIPTT